MSNRTRRIQSAARLSLLLWAAASTCSPQARAQDVNASDGTVQVDEWRLEGQIVRLDAVRSAFWMEPEVTVLGNEATLDGSDRARRITVDASTQVWTPDGITRPFGFNALDQAVRGHSEITVVGTRESSSQGPILRARLLVLPDLLPRGWKPRPLATALRRANAPASSSARRSAPLRTLAAPTSTHSTPQQKQNSKAQAQLAQARLEQQRLKQQRLEKQRLTRQRLEQQRLAQQQLAQAQAKEQLAKEQLAQKQLAQQARRAQQQRAQAELAQAQRAREQLEQQKLERTHAARAQRARLAAEALRARRAQPPTLSTAQAGGLAINSATALRSAGSAAAPELAPRDSKPPLLASSLPSSQRAPSAPRVALASPGGEGQVTMGLNVEAQQPNGEARRSTSLQARSQAAPPATAPRDVQHERLRVAPPQTSRQDVPSSWTSSPLVPDAAPVPATPSRQAQASPLGMRATLPSGGERRLVLPPLLSSPAFDSSSRLPALPSVAPQTPLPSARAPQVLEPSTGAPGGLDAVQGLVTGEQQAAQAKQEYASLRALQDQVSWADFCGGPGWDSRLATAAGVASGIQVAQSGATKLIALTFDDGPHANTARILDILDANGAKATFFLVGRNVQKNPAMVREIARRGNDIGSHSFHHFQGVRLSLSQWQQEVDDNNQTLAGILGVAPRWFRAPGCHYSDEALQALRSRRMVRVDSSNNSGDWHEPNPDKIVAGVLSRLAPGQVLLFHDPLTQTARALPILLREITARGYKCVTLTELARASAQDASFTPPLCPPGQGIILPPDAFATRAQGSGQVLETPSAPSSLPADAPVLLQVQP